MPSLIAFQKKIMVTKLLVQKLHVRICSMYECQETKLESIFQQTFYCRKQTRLQHFQCSGDEFAQEIN